MTCSYCQFSNANDDHRCRRCGRRVSVSPAAVPQRLAQENVFLALRASGANALAAEAVAAHVEPAARNGARNNDVQPSLFGSELQPKIIPFDSLPRPAARQTSPVKDAGQVAQLPDVPRSAPRGNSRKARSTGDTQTSLDFLQPTKNASKVLKTNAEAVIYCDALAASPLHRSAATALDATMVILGFGIVLGIFEFLGRPVGLNRNSFLMLGGMLMLCAMFYSLLFAIAGAITPGLRWTELRIINFDGFPPDARSRALRLAGGWIGLLSGGLGLLWALLDEEGLTWHDHMSKTFPTLRESTSIIVRHTRR